MHDSQHRDLVNSGNHTRNLIRTAAGNVQRMEDREGAEHIHQRTPFQASELNLGHMVDEGRKERGQGAELRTDGAAAVRGARGVLISAEAQPSAAGQQLDMQDADATLEQAEQILRALNDTARVANAIQAEIDQQRLLIQQKLKQLQKPVIVATAPDGLGLASGTQMQIAARRQMFVTAGDGLDIGVMRRVAIAAGEAISLFAARLGIRIFAAKGTVQVQAQSDAMELMSMLDMTASSSDGEVVITGRKGVTIGDGSGAYIKLSGGKIILGSPAGEIELKGNVKVGDADGGSFKFPTWSSAPLNDVKNVAKFGFSE
jgi:type VI secretion system secreted protein VgrG